MQCAQLLNKDATETYGSFTCMAAARNIVFMGTDGGYVVKWKIHKEENQEEACKKESERNFIKPVEVLLYDAMFNRLFVLVDGEVSMHDGDTLSHLLTLKEAKGAYNMTLNLSLLDIADQRHKICVSVKKKLLIFAYSPEADYTYAEELVLASNVVALGYSGTRLTCGYPKEYVSLQTTSGETSDLFTLNEGDGSPYVFQMKTQALVRIANLAFIVKEADTEHTDYHNDDKGVSNITFSTEPLAFGKRHPYIFGLQNECVQVYSLYENNMVGTLDLQRCFLCSSCYHKQDKVLMGSSNSLYLIHVPTVKEEVEQLVSKLKIESAFDYIATYPTKNEQLQADRTQKLHTSAAVSYLKHHSFSDGFHHLTQSGADARNVLTLHFPYCVAEYTLETFSPDMHHELLLPAAEVEQLRGTFSGLQLVSTSVARLQLVYRVSTAGCVGKYNTKTTSTTTTTLLSSSTSSLYSLQSSTPSPSSSPTTPVSLSHATCTSPRLNGHQLLITAHDAHTPLVAYLQYRKAVSKDTDELRAVDYALLILCCIEGLADKLYDLLSQENNHCHLDDCVPLLTKSHHYRLLALLYQHKGMSDETLHALSKCTATMYHDQRRCCANPRELPREWEGLPDVQYNPDKDLSKIFVAMEIAKPEYISSTLMNAAMLADKMDSVNNTLLHYAVTACNTTPELTHVICRLVDNGFDINQTNGFGITPLQIASPKVAGAMRAIADVYSLITRSSEPPTPNLSHTLPTIPTFPPTPSSINSAPPK